MSKDLKGYTHRNYPREAVHFSTSGDCYELVYAYEYDEDGCKVLRPSERHNFNIDIQRDAPLTDINTIIQRASVDPEVLNQVHGFYADVTEMPTTLAEVFNRSEQAQNVFNRMPADFKEMFNNNFVQFWSEFGTENFNTKMNDFNAKSNEVGIKYKGVYYTPEQLDALLLTPHKNEKVGGSNE